MIHDLITRSIHATSAELDPETKIFSTIFVPTKTVTATISLSTFTFGARDRTAGWGGCVIRKAGFATGPGSSDSTPVASSFEQNSLYVERCVFVTYQLSIALGEAIAQFNLFFHEPVASLRRKKSSTRQALVFDKKSGVLQTVHHLETLPGARVPSDRYLKREILTCAGEELRLAERSLDLAFREEAAFQFRPDLRVDRATGGVRG